MNQTIKLNDDDKLHTLFAMQKAYEKVISDAVYFIFPVWRTAKYIKKQAKNLKKINDFIEQHYKYQGPYNYDVVKRELTLTEVDKLTNKEIKG